MSDIICAGVSHTYPGGVLALDGLDLQIGAGERVAIVGQNGSGKTTLVRHFNGLLRPSAGSVNVGGADTRTTRIAQLAHLVALAFQDPDRQIFAGSVEAEASFGARNLKLRGKELEESVAGALESVGLAGERQTNPYDLGYSRRKLLTIASVVAMQTPIIVLDEPTTGQDARGVRTIEAIVSKLTQAGRTVVCISHDMRFVAETFARVVVMRSGRIVFDGGPGEVFAEANWETLGSTNLEPPYAARVGAALNLESTPTIQALVGALGSVRSG